MTQPTQPTQPLPSPDQLLGGGVPSAAFLRIGDVVRGFITEEPQTQQQRDMDTNELKFWKDGNPMVQVRVVVQTDQVDPEIEGDDGLRAHYLSSRKLKAVREALREAKSARLEIGGELIIKFESEDPPTRKGFNPPKNYRAKYVPPAKNETDNDDPWAAPGTQASKSVPSAPAAPAPADPFGDEPPF